MAPVAPIQHEGLRRIDDLVQEKFGSWAGVSKRCSTSDFVTLILFWFLSESVLDSSGFPHFLIAQPTLSQKDLHMSNERNERLRRKTSPRHLPCCPRHGLQSHQRPGKLRWLRISLSLHLNMRICVVYIHTLYSNMYMYMYTCTID